ncbi:MAG TPA: four helix bundle protein [Cyclobacteriaceae bacterium]|nr:four helix bundle protein [Cyclobacteriaceae bacterium]
MSYVKSFKELEVYRTARALSEEIFEVSKSFPKGEMYSLTDQIRRSSRSIGAQIAEGWANRKYEIHFISKLTDSDGEQLETQHWIETAVDCEYLSKEQSMMLFQKCSSIGRMLCVMTEKAPSFCNNK